ncbi:FAD/NAD(P)-binding oxidoreductase [Methanohalophilus sp.]|uniref:NAD(P)/FAD-dependent oxidoreductase n=1 Tax=Methanohalophilus sp. TaxID=1966352 RepID=UPI00261AB6BD|nr:FAD/NAD(P)-binding oxidoreductase [Methanohalophilus sp.]MDK2893195.1 sulfide:quinone oxidoreductase [Methanohalophilus sp.]
MTDKILILGAGYAGAVVANKLAREFRRSIAKGKVDITVLDKDEMSVNQGGFTFLPFSLYTPEDIIRSKRELLSPRINLKLGPDGEVTSIDMNKQQVGVKSGNKYDYDYLVIALGARADISGVEGLTDDLNTFYTSIEDSLKLGEKIRNFNGGRIAVSVARMPIPCPGAPIKFSFLLDSYFKNVLKRDDVTISLFWPMEPIGPPEFNKMVTGKFEEKGIEVFRNFKLGKVDASNKVIESTEGEKEKYDLLVTVPPHKVQQVILDAGINDESGWIPFDKSTLQYRGGAGNYDNVYVLGDTGPMDVLKTGIGAHYQAMVVAHNLANDINGNGIKVSYNGETGCPIITDMAAPSMDGKAYIATWSYNLPPDEFDTTKLGWYMYRMYYYIHWDASIKAIL